MSETTNADLYAPIPHARTADEVVARIERLILDGVLRDGDRLPGERDLARRLDVSRPILREALKVLETRGLLVSQHGGGTFVADIIGQVFSQPLIDLISRHGQARQDYLEYRRALEGMTAALAAERATADDRAHLATLIAQMRAAHAVDDYERELEADIAFHNAIGESAHNMVLLHTMRACYRLLSEGILLNRRMVFAAPGAHDALLSQHEAILDGILAGDPGRARQAAEAHIDFIIEAARAADRAGDRARVSQLRRLHRGDDATDSNGKA
ncbi:transcriptional regulator, GntR family [Rhizobium sp. RU20A]|uniref:FadR/GntR family transcriptional regulator n=1 Tax=Rhizobium sp. RU20A TaxID=1907412 RepID=UPI000956227E|nr:FCD domain-containing protein [Rhizobium sp. RU20A]SIR05988.1 transcriptional regulator, GntR family [Rhizobium sp. RU20A]